MMPKSVERFSGDIMLQRFRSIPEQFEKTPSLTLTPHQG
jgi:hypothetical protein